MKELIKAKANWVSVDLGCAIFESAKDIERQPFGALISIQGLSIGGVWEDARKLNPNGLSKQNIFGITFASKLDASKIKLDQEYSIIY